MKPSVLIIMGSDSDFPQLEKGIALLRQMEVPFEVAVSSAHRTPERTLNLVRDFEARGGQIIIAAAGGAAHLPGVVAGHTLLPVLGVPMTSNLSGVDSLYAIVQMPGGIPVGTLGVGSAGGQNAALLAMQILALHDGDLASRLRAFRREQAEGVVEKDRKLQERLAAL